MSRGYGQPGLGASAFGGRFLGARQAGLEALHNVEHGHRHRCRVLPLQFLSPDLAGIIISRNWALRSTRPSSASGASAVAAQTLMRWPPLANTIRPLRDNAGAAVDRRSAGQLHDISRREAKPLKTGSAVSLWNLAGRRAPASAGSNLRVATSGASAGWFSANASCPSHRALERYRFGPWSPRAEFLISASRSHAPRRPCAEMQEFAARCTAARVPALRDWSIRRAYRQDRRSPPRGRLC